MSNLTISVDDELIKRARVRAIQQGTSLSAKVRDYLQHYVNESEEMLKQQRDDATARLMAAIATATTQTQVDTAATAPDAGPRMTLRDELYEGDFRAGDRLGANSAS